MKYYLSLSLLFVSSVGINGTMYSINRHGLIDEGSHLENGSMDQPGK